MPCRKLKDKLIRTAKAINLKQILLKISILVYYQKKACKLDLYSIKTQVKPNRFGKSWEALIKVFLLLQAITNLPYTLYLLVKFTVEFLQHIISNNGYNDNFRQIKIKKEFPCFEQIKVLQLIQETRISIQAKFKWEKIHTLTFTVLNIQLYVNLFCYYSSVSLYHFSQNQPTFNS